MNTTVQDLQRRMIALGFNPGPADGIAGPKTKAAVRIFQIAEGLPVNGIAGPKTSARLREKTDAPKSSAEMTTSAAGRKAITAHEDNVLTAYPDPATGGEPWTIGVGHTSAAGPPKVVRGMKITEAESDEILSRDLKTFEAGVRFARVGEGGQQGDAGPRQTPCIRTCSFPQALKGLTMQKPSKAIAAAAGGAATVTIGLPFMPEGTPWYGYLALYAITTLLPAVPTYAAPANKA